MIIVSEDSITKAIDTLNALEDNAEAFQKLMEQFGEEQPAVFSYIIAMEEEFKDEDNLHQVLYDATLLWQAFKNETTIFPVVNDAKLVEIQEHHLGKYENLENSPDSKLNSFAEESMKTINQPDLFRLIVEDIYGHEEEGQEEDEDYIHDSGLSYIMLQIILDCFDNAVNGDPIIMN